MSDYYPANYRAPESNLPLFDTTPSVPTATSRAAARKVKPLASKMAAVVLAYLQRCGAEGATDEEIRHGTGLTESTARARRVGLVKTGLVQDSGRHRRGKSGCKMTVWRTVANVRALDSASPRR